MCYGNRPSKIYILKNAIIIIIIMMYYYYYLSGVSPRPLPTPYFFLRLGDLSSSSIAHESKP